MTAPADELSFHAESPRRDEGYGLALGRPGADGLVWVREWPMGAYLEPPRERAAPVDELVARVRRWERDGWRFTAPPSAVLDWLRAGPGAR